MSDIIKTKLYIANIVNDIGRIIILRGYSVY